MAAFASRQQPMVAGWLALGMQALRSGQKEQAQAWYEKVIQVSQSNSDAWLWLGVIHHQNGNTGDALESIAKAINYKPLSAQPHVILGNVNKDLKRYVEAEANYKDALKISPNSVEALNNLGTLFCELEKFDEAAGCFNRVVLLQPKYAEGYNNLGTVLVAQSKIADARTAFQSALDLNPEYGQAYLNLGDTYMKAAPHLALEHFEKAVLYEPHSFLAWVHLGKIHAWTLKLDEARKCFQKAYSINPLGGIRIMDALMLPTIMGTLEEVHAIRGDFEKNLEVLIAEKVSVMDPVREFCAANFHLAYHGINDRPLQQRIAQFYEQACPSLLYTASHCKMPRQNEGRKRLGFYSQFIVKHSVAASCQALIESLAASGKFDLFIISGTEVDDDTVRAAYPSIGGNFIRVGAKLVAVREQIAALELDVLVYLDIGMEPLGYFLGYSRLAHVQCVAGGHPVTTGIGNIDYFLSGELIETPDAQTHYSEKLVTLPYGLLYISKPTPPERYKSRLELGLPEAGNIYLVPFVLHKLHPDFDVAMQDILWKDQNGTIVLIGDKIFPEYSAKLSDRFDKTIDGAVRSRVRFGPWQANAEDFMSVIHHAAVILDTFHFGMGTTISPIAAVGTPFVTFPSDFQRGRVGLYFCKLMGLEDFVATSIEEYVELAVSISTDSLKREELRARFLAQSPVLFKNAAAIEDFENFLKSC